MPADLLDPPRTDLNLRERKKLATRQALLHSALDLFARRGVEATTVEDIAEAVGVSARTFHRYFAAKEDVLFADWAQRQARFARFLAARPDDEPVLASLRAAVQDLVANIYTDPDDERRRMQLVVGSVTLRARSLQLGDELRSLVAEHVARRLGSDPGELLPRLLASLTLGTLRAARERWLVDPSHDYHEAIDDCFDLLADLHTATTR